MRRWVEFERNGRTVGTFVSEGSTPARSGLSFPYVISDAMPPTEQVDGRFYESKSQFRAVGRALGLIEVGNEKVKPRSRASADPAFRRKRKEQLKDAIEKHRAGHYERYFSPDGSRRYPHPTGGDDT